MDNEQRNRIEKEAARVQEDAMFSSKGHFNAASRWTVVHHILGVPTALIAGISGVSAFNEMPELAGALAILAAGLAALTTFLNPSKKSATHHGAGTSFNSLKSKVRRLQEIDTPNEDIPVQELRERLEEFSLERDALNEASPQIPRSAFKKARKGIDEGEAKYEVE